jgi:hypothetical protein
MRFSLCLVLTLACGERFEPAPPPGPATTVSRSAQAAVAPPGAPPPRPPLTAAHGAEITTLATTADGDAVVSADRLGGIRLWPALDGTREPVVIQGPAPRSITLARDGDGFVIGVLDAAGGVQLIRASAAGAVRGRATPTRGQPALEIAGTSEGLLVLRADQAIELVAADGALRTRLTPDPGSHVTSLVARGDRVLALVQEDRQLHGRWIVIDHGARWGTVTPKLPFKPARAVLSPDGALLAASRTRDLHPSLIDVATGVARKAPLCVTRGWPREDGHGSGIPELLRGDNPPTPLGFLSNTVVACSVIGSLIWWNVSGTMADTMVGAIHVAGAHSAVSTRGLIAGVGPSLAISTPSSNQFLGYGLHDVARLSTGAGGVLLGGEQHAFVLDAGLRERARLELGRAGLDASDAVLVDERYAITTTTVRAIKRPHNQLAVFDGVTRTVHQRLPYETSNVRVAYEPTTRLLATNDGARSLLVRFDPVSHTFGPPVQIGSAIMTSRLALVDPALGGGVVALTIDHASDGVLVGELRDAELTPGQLAQPRTTYRVPGELRAVDRAGRLYMRLAEAPDDVVIYTRGERGARLAGMGELSVRPNADGSLIAAFEAPRLALLGADGVARWDTAHWSGTEVGWTAGGELLVAFVAAVGRVDLATGALAERRCGWGFGLSDQPHETGRGEASICDAAR